MKTGRIPDRATIARLLERAADVIDEVHAKGDALVELAALADDLREARANLGVSDVEAATA